MPKKTDNLSWLENIKSTWGTLAGFALFVFGIVGTFVLPPPGWVTASGDKTLLHLGQFIVAVLSGLVLILVIKWKRKKHLRRWILITLGSLFLSVGSYFAYQHFLDTRTCKYFDELVVIGSSYTQRGSEYVKENASETCSTLLEDFAGKADDIWTPNSINQSRYVLALSYIISIPLFTICLIATVQAVYCAGRN